MYRQFLCICLLLSAFVCELQGQCTAFASVQPDNSPYCVGGAATFSGSWSTGSGALSYQWIITPDSSGPEVPGDAIPHPNQSSTTSFDLMVSYLKAGKIRVSLIVTDNNCSDTYSATYVISQRQNVSRIYGNIPPRMCTGDTALFVDSIPFCFGPSCYSQRWKVEGGGTIVQRRFFNASQPGQHSYDSIWVVFNQPGPARVISTLSAFSQQTCSFFDTVALQIGGPPPALNYQGPDSVFQSRLNQFAVGPSLLDSINWMAVSGTILSGQGTDSVVVRWDSLGWNTLYFRGYERCQGWLLDSFQVYVLPPPPPAFLSGLSSRCTGDSAWYRLNPALGAYAYQWLVKGGTLGTTAFPDSAVVKFSGSQSNSEVIVVRSLGSARDSIKLPVNVFSIAGNLSVDTSDMCAPETRIVTLNRVPGDRISWAFSHLAVDSVNADSSRLVLRANLIGAAYIKVSQQDGSCLVGDSVSFQVHPPIIPTISGPDTICVSQSTSRNPYLRWRIPSFYGNFQHSFSWTGSQEISFGGGSQTSYSAAAYIHTYKSNYWLAVDVTSNQTGCSGQDTLLIKGYPEPSLLPVSYFSPFICPGDTEMITMGNNVPGRVFTVSLTTSGPQPTIIYQSPNRDTILYVVPQNAVNNQRLNLNVYYVDSFCPSLQQFHAIFVQRPPALNLPSDVPLCQGGPVTLNPASTFNTYQWSNGATTQRIMVNQAGSYSVIAQASNGCRARDTVVVFDPNSPTLDLGNDTILCLNTPLLLDAGPWDSILWAGSGVNGLQTQTILASQTGQYTAAVVDSFGCQDLDTIDLQFVGLPAVDLGPDTAVCWNGNPLMLQAGGGYASYAWSNGSTLSAIAVSNSGTYSVSVTDSAGCTSSDQIQVTILSRPVVNLGPDTLICGSGMLSLDAGSGGAGYTWSTGNTVQSISVNTSGLYQVTVTASNGCAEMDSIQVTFLPLPVVSLGADTTLCRDTALVLQAGTGFSAYQWSDGSTGAALQVDSGAIWWVEVTDGNGCQGRDSMLLTISGDCVFPGDANYDGVANNVDLLALGLAGGSTGPLRAGASLNWYGQQATDWVDTLSNGVNYKHADVDGNGVVNLDDTLGITLNFGKTHSKTGGVQGTYTMLLRPLQDTVLVGNPGWFVLELGDVQNPADSVYGLAYTLGYDVNLANGRMVPDYSNSWLGSGAALWSVAVPFPGEVAAGVVRHDQVDQNGFGELARFRFEAVSSLPGGDWKALFTPSLNNLWLIAADGTRHGASVVVDSVLLYDPLLGRASAGLQLEDQIQVWPNPAGSVLYVSQPGEGIVRLLDILGREMKTHVNRRVANGQTLLEFDVSGLPAGGYVIEVMEEGRRFVKRVLIQH